MRPANLAHLYRVRLRSRLSQECLAVIGIGAGVALLFASQIASSSLSTSVAELSRGVIGSATEQLIARDPRGMSQNLVRQVRQIAGVRAAAPLLEAPANARGPQGSRSVELIGADESLARLGGSLARRENLAPFAHIAAVALTSGIARTVGVRRFGQELTLEAAGNVTRSPLYAVLGREQVGGLAATPIVLAPLFYAQEATGAAGRISRILVASAPAHKATVRAALERIAGSEANVERTDYDERLFSLAAAPTNQATALFAAISALVGFLFAFNTMLLTVPQRRRLTTDLRREGYQPHVVITVIVLDAAVLGALACVLGLVVGDELSRQLFGSNPGYLSSAFTVGSQRTVSAHDVVIAVAGGLVAAIAAVLAPLREMLSRDRLGASAQTDTPSRLRTARLALAGVACLAGATAILIVAPTQAVLGMVLLVAAMLLTLALPLTAAVNLVGRLAPSVISVVPHVAVTELRTGRARALAIAATGAVAVFGGVAIQSAHGDLLRGLEGAAHDMNAFTDVWVSPSGSFNLLETTPFTPARTAQLARLPGVRGVRIYRGDLLDWGNRRIWVIAPPDQAEPLLPASQLLQGGAALATKEIRSGGWAVVSQALADEHGLRVGSRFTAPTPHPMAMRVAAISTNIGWAPGAMIVSASQYAQAWASDDASAYNVLAAPGTTAGQVANEVRRTLGPSSGLAVETADAHADRQRALGRQGLQRLTQIATLILIVAVLAMAAAMGSLVWQRRPRLAKLKLEGFPRATLWRTLVFEASLLLGVGCVVGAAFGLYGQVLLDRALADVVGFPVLYSFGGTTALAAMAVVTGAAVAVVSVPGYLAADVAPAVALQD